MNANEKTIKITEAQFDKICGAKFQVVRLVEGRMIDNIYAGENIFEVLAMCKNPCTGLSENRFLREELQEMPEFERLAGPMWGGFDSDGAPIIRYEDWKTNEILSA